MSDFRLHDGFPVTRSSISTCVTARPGTVQRILEIETLLHDGAAGLSRGRRMSAVFSAKGKELSNLMDEMSVAGTPETSAACSPA